MISRLLVSFIFLAFMLSIGGFVVFAAWDVPVEQMKVEKTIDSSHFLEKNP